MIRSLWFLVDGFFFGLVGYTSMQKSPLNQRYGDVWGHTVVVAAANVPAGSERGTLQLMGGLMLGIGCQAAVVIVDLCLKAMG